MTFTATATRTTMKVGEGDDSDAGNRENDDGGRTAATWTQTWTKHHAATLPGRTWKGDPAKAISQRTVGLHSSSHTAQGRRCYPPGAKQLGGSGSRWMVTSDKVRWWRRVT